MDQKVLDFLKNERVCSLAVIMPDGTSHSAAMYFSLDPTQNSIYFLTPKSSHKCQAVANDKVASASIAVGFSEVNMITSQLKGSLRLASKNTLSQVKSVYFAKYPDSRKYDSPHSANLVFEVLSWKYINHKTEETITS